MAWFIYYANGNFIGLIIDIFNFLISTTLTSGKLVGIGMYLAEILRL